MVSSHMPKNQVSRIYSSQLRGLPKSSPLVTSCVLILLLLIALVTVTVGTYNISVGGVIDTLTGGGNDTDRHIILHQRLPRLTAALLVGAALGVAGCIFQAVSRNPLGSPDVIGFTTGSATGALITILVMGTTGTDTALAAGLPGLGTGLGALAGGFTTAALVLLLVSQRAGTSMGYRLVLVGIAVGAMLASVNDYLLTRADLERAETAKTWLYGSLNALTWEQVTVPAIALVCILPLSFTLLGKLRILEMGEDLATGLGLPVRPTVWLLMTVAITVTAAAIALAGPIGFVALIAQQIARRLWHTPGAALWESALTGALLLALADFVAARALSPFQIPVGLVTGAVGGLYLLLMIGKTTSHPG